MTTTPADLLTSSLLEVFGERDPARRRVAMERVYSSTIEFYDAEGFLTGYDKLNDKVTELLEGAPADWVFAAAAPAAALADLGRATWVFGPVGAPIVRGTDIGLVVDGLITKLYTFLDQP